MESAYSFDPKKFRLGTLCGRQHDWQLSGKSLRRTSGSNPCVECEKIHNAAKQMLRRQYLKRYAAAKRAEMKELGLTKRGTVPVDFDLRAAIRAAGQSPSVARLVMDEQVRHWRENPADYAEHRRRWAQSRWWLRYAINPDLRLYHREKSKRRKAQDCGQTPMQIPVSALRQRFINFNNCCAYCGTDGDMQIEHVVPISKNGAHDIGNIVPSCMSCNLSKRSQDMEKWYVSQPFFSELRLSKIQNVLRPPGGVQLDLAIA